MSRRSGQRGNIVRKGNQWHIRFYADVAGQEARQRRSVSVGPCTGPNKLTKSVAERKGAEIIAALGVNTAEYLEHAMNPVPVMTFGRRVEWCRRYHKAWTDGKPGPIQTMESQLHKHILPVFGDMPLDSIDEMVVQEFIADLKRRTFERRSRNGKLIKRYKLKRKTVLNICGLIKLIVGKKIWLSWDLDLGKSDRSRQRYYTEAELVRIIEAASARYRLLFIVTAATGVRMGEATGLHVEDIDLNNRVIYVRREVWRGKEQDPKTPNAVRVIDIDDELCCQLREHLGDRKTGRLFESRNGTPLNGNNIRRRVLQPLLKKLGIPIGGFHAFRHARVTVLRKRGIPGDLQKQWIGHSSLRITDNYSHTDQELEYRREAASKAGMKLVNGPNGPKLRVEPLSVSA
jgi:integrase